MPESLIRMVRICHKRGGVLRKVIFVEDLKEAIAELEKEIQKESQKALEHQHIHLRGEWYSLQKLKEKLGLEGN